jgi:cytochrome c biogenesis protein CcmG, thiol:disulfide interchange protein DsbE
MPSNQLNAYQNPAISRASISSGERVSNPRPSAWEADALPTELPPHPRRILRAAGSRLTPRRACWWAGIHAASLLLGVVSTPAVKLRPLPILATLLGAAVVALLAYGVSTQAPNRTLDELVARGQYPPAPQAAHPLPVLGGAGARTLASLRGKVVVLNFWASWCSSCQAETPLLERTQSNLARHDATVLGVTYQDAAPESERFVREYHITYPIVRDATGEFAHSYGTRQLPESFLIDRQGRIVQIERGEIEPSFLQHAEALAASS